jgi:DNA-binding IclR family transcriptional regulator
MDDEGSKPAGYQAPALIKGLEIIEFLAERAGAFTMVEIAKALGRSHNEIYRMLVVLERRGYLARTADDRFSLTGRLFDLAMRQAPSRNLHDAALPAMHRLAETTWQSCHLAVLSDTDIVVVARVESPDLLGFAVRVGYRRPIVRSTSGRVLFAHQSEAAAAALAERLAPAESAADWRSFLADCKQAKRDGWFAGPSAYVASITDIGAPIFDGAHEGAIASLTMPYVQGVAAHTSSAEATAAVVRVAAGISEVLRSG